MSVVVVVVIELLHIIPLCQFKQIPNKTRESTTKKKKRKIYKPKKLHYSFSSFPHPTLSIALPLSLCCILIYIACMYVCVLLFLFYAAGFIRNYIASHRIKFEYILFEREEKKKKKRKHKTFWAIANDLLMRSKKKRAKRNNIGGFFCFFFSCSHTHTKTYITKITVLLLRLNYLLYSMF